MSLLGAILAALAIGWIVYTMPVGRRIAARLGLPERGAGRVPAEDRAYLLRVSGGDPAEVERRLAAERARFADLSEADIHRRAIRTYLNRREGGGLGPDETGA